MTKIYRAFFVALAMCFSFSSLAENAFSENAASGNAFLSDQKRGYFNFGIDQGYHHKDFTWKDIAFNFQYGSLLSTEQALIGGFVFLLPIKESRSVIAFQFGYERYFWTNQRFTFGAGAFFNLGTVSPKEPPYSERYKGYADASTSTDASSAPAPAPAPADEEWSLGLGAGAEAFIKAMITKRIDMFFKTGMKIDTQPLSEFEFNEVSLYLGLHLRFSRF